MDVRIKTFQEATAALAYLARLDLAELKEKPGDERLMDGMQNGRAQKFEYTAELCWESIKVFLKEQEGTDEASPKRSSKPITSGGTSPRTIICCYLMR